MTSNADGESRVKFVVSRVQPPIRFAVDGFQVEGDRTKLISPNLKIPDSRVWIVGRVQWPDAEVQRRNASARIQVLVNGFPQVETALIRVEDQPGQAAKPGSDRIENRFRAGILLNRAGEYRGNETQRRRGGGRCASRSRWPVSNPIRDSVYTCSSSASVRRISGHSRSSPFKRSTANSISDKKEERVFTTPAFSSGRVYGPLCDEFTKMHVMAQISLICEQIRLRSNATGAPNENDVVLIYYQGGEWVGENRTSLLIRRGRAKDSVDGVTVDELVRPFVNTRGAKLMLLDVATAGPFRKDEPWSRDVAHVGLMRFLWLSSSNEERPEIPEDLRLIGHLKDVLPNTITLGQVTSEISGRYSQLRPKYPNRFVFEDHPLPDPFYDLLFGKP